jgi:Tol biopolymer transport system component
MAGWATSRCRPIAALVVASLMLSVPVEAATRSVGAEHGLIVFSSQRSGGLELYSVGALGGEPRQLTAHSLGGAKHPAWSFDGRSIAVETQKTHRLPGAPKLVVSRVEQPAWSPDGRRLVGTLGYDVEVRIESVRTGAMTTIYEDSGIGHPGLGDPAWSPDGRRIVFASDVGLIWYDVEHRKVLWGSATHPAPGAGRPAWSPDGRRLAFDTSWGSSCDQPAQPCAIWVAGAAGSHARRIATNAFDPAWSPDGREIAFDRVLARANSEIYVMNADGGNQRRLTFNRGPDLQPTWQPHR